MVVEASVPTSSRDRWLEESRGLGWLDAAHHTVTTGPSEWGRPVDVRSGTRHRG